MSLPLRGPTCDSTATSWSHGEYYTIEPLKTLPRVTSLSPIWAVSRRGEFIGTLPYHQDETTKEFEVRCLSWVRDLLGTPLSQSRH